MKKVKVYKVDGTFYEVDDPGVIVPDSTPPQQRENAYNTAPAIEWDGEMLTVTQTIREQFPDKEVE